MEMDGIYTYDNLHSAIGPSEVMYSHSVGLREEIALHHYDST